MKTFYIRRYETPSGYNFYVSDPNARKKSSPIMGEIRCNTITEAIKALKSYFNTLQIEMGRGARDE